MITVYKYQFDVRQADVHDVIEIEMPEGAEILTVQVQHEKPCIWAKVDTEKPLKPVRFRIAGTGHKLYEKPEAPILARENDGFKYIGSFQLYGGDLVFHLFELE